MKLPHSLLSSPFFVFSNESEFLRALVGEISDDEMRLICTLNSRNLPPVTSRSVLATMFGISPGLVWSFVARTPRHYREFSIPKGSGKRLIQAPKVSLKIIQKWLSVQFERVYSPPSHVFGFVQGRSHVMAAIQHSGASWVFSVDIKDFFQTTPQSLVVHSFRKLGYEADGAALIASLCCYNGFLAQGAPSSPIISNLCFSDTDMVLASLADKYKIRVTRYADDIVFSGNSDFSEALIDDVRELFEDGPWKLALNKTELAMAPKQRLKVHGLLVSGNAVRLTKGYRNRIRGFQHALKIGKVREEDLNRLKGHINYAKMVSSAVAVKVSGPGS